MIRWGILGCGDVTEIKSGPALQKAARSSVVACMRRDRAKAEDYAARHAIARAYDDVDALIADAEVNAVYIATPPDSHADLTIRALEAGKAVLVEKPMALNTAECDRMIAAAEASGRPLTIAYYRRALPRFEKLREVVQGGGIGIPRCIRVEHFAREADRPGQSWKLDPSIGGGGFFTDMQTHTLDWLDYVFGPANSVAGSVRHLAAGYPAEDLVSYVLGFDTVVASGLCAYTTGQKAESVTIIGSEGSASMSFFAPSPVTVMCGDERRVHDLPDPAHVHQPFIERVVAHFLGEGENPCPPEAARRTTAVVEALYSGG